MPMNEREFQARLRAIFDAEAGEHLRALAEGLFALEQRPAPSAAAEVIETLFREAHTLKGGARLVNEKVAERICQDLETLFFTLKNQGGTLNQSELTDLRAQIGQLRVALNFPETAEERVLAPVTSVASTAESRAEADTDKTQRKVETPPAENRAVQAQQVRVPAERLDALLLQAEEMLTTKTNSTEHFESLETLRDQMAIWKKQWAKFRPQLAATRTGNPGQKAIEPRELKQIWTFLEWNREFFGSVENELDRLTRSFGKDHRWANGLVDGLLEQTKEVLMLPFSSLVESFPSFIKEYSASHAKPIELRIEGGDTQLDRRVLDEIKDAILHLVRNAIDHGIESTQERAQSAKPATGTLIISVVPRSGSSVEIAVRDDGGGIDVEAIRRAAIEQNLFVDSESDRSESELLSLLFRSGFSTRSEVTDLSGRGLGLAIVAEKVERLGGNVTIETKIGQGTAFRLLLPITMARFRGVFVTSAEQTFVISSSFVEEILRVSPTQIHLVKHQSAVEFRGQPILLTPLSEVLGLGAGQKLSEGQRYFVVVVRAGPTCLGLLVDEAPHESEVIMKDLGKLLPRVRNISGATMIGAGRIVPVLNAADLVRSAGRRRAAPSAPAKASARRPRAARKILIVEDSITSRTLLKSILDAAGYQVRTAFDGIEAVTQLKYEPVDLVISDVQMPRMDGIELARKIRSDSALSTIPIILVTSLATREDKERGVEAGANAYIVKSSFDQSDLLKTVERLLS